MKRRLITFIIAICIVLNTVPSFSATVIKKEDAGLYSKKSIYSEIDVNEGGGGNPQANGGYLPSGSDGEESGGLRNNDDTVNKFSVPLATRNGDTYTNIWSNYTITFDEIHKSANDVYDFYTDGMKYDFGIYFDDWSRIAIYYTRLSKDLNVVAANFAPGQPVTDVVIAGETYKHVSLDVPYPYGIEKYNYYLRNVDGKLMVIETYHEDGREISIGYIDKFVKAK